MSERDAFIEQMEREKQCGRPRGIRIRGGSHDYTSKWRERPDDNLDPLHKLLASAYSAYLVRLEVEEPK
jgi:hypothetical protein